LNREGELRSGGAVAGIVVDSDVHLCQSLVDDIAGLQCAFTALGHSAKFVAYRAKATTGRGYGLSDLRIGNAFTDTNVHDANLALSIFGLVKNKLMRILYKR
jgi:hypothetical protein